MSASYTRTCTVQYTMYTYIICIQIINILSLSNYIYIYTYTCIFRIYNVLVYIYIYKFKFLSYHTLWHAAYDVLLCTVYFLLYMRFFIYIYIYELLSLSLVSHFDLMRSSSRVPSSPHTCRLCRLLPAAQRKVHAATERFPHALLAHRQARPTLDEATALFPTHCGPLQSPVAAKPSHVSAADR